MHTHRLKRSRYSATRFPDEKPAAPTCPLRSPRVFIRSKATCAAPLCEVLTPCRGLRPHHVQRDCIGTWEISCLAAVVTCCVSTAVRIGNRGAVADDARTREVGPRHSSDEAGEQREESPLRRRLRGRSQRCRWSEGRGPRGIRTSKARTGLRARVACQRRWSVYGDLCRYPPEAGAVCGKAARTDLGGGRAMKRTSLPLRGYFAA